MVSVLFLVSLVGAEEGPILDRMLGNVHPAVCTHLLPQWSAPLVLVVAASSPAVLALVLCPTELLDCHCAGPVPSPKQNTDFELVSGDGKGGASVLQRRSQLSCSSAQGSSRPALSLGSGGEHGRRCGPERIGLRLLLAKSCQCTLSWHIGWH